MKISLGVLLLCISIEALAADKPNILFILSDNQAASLLGTYGNPDVRTPNIDQLASEGIRFDRAFAVNGMCSPTRATLMTALMPSQHGLHNWLDDELMHEWPRDWSAVHEFRTLPQTLADNGYRTALIGKWHLGQPWQPSIGFQHWLTFTAGHTLDFWNNTIVDNGDTYKVEGQHIVDFFTDKAVAYINAHDKDDKPFFLLLSYDGPYVNPPTNMGPAKNRHYASYADKDLKSFPRSSVHPNLVRQLIDYAREHRDDAFLARIIQAVLRMNGDPATRANIASQNTIVDDGVGRVLKALSDKGLDENTLIIYSADQGNYYGQQGLWTHTTITTPSSLHDTPMRVPLIFRFPGKIAKGQSSDMLIGQYDIAPTILDAVGLGHVRFDNSPGKSFADRLDSTADIDWTDAVFFEQEDSRGIRTATHSYWARIPALGENALFDISKDPEQLKDIAAENSVSDLKAALHARVTKFFGTYRDPQYDLWAGGTAKGSVVRPEVYQRLYGADWSPRTPMLPAFKGD